MRGKNADRSFEYLPVDCQKLRTILVESLPLHAVLHIPLQYKSHIRTLRYVLTLASTIPYLIQYTYDKF